MKGTRDIDETLNDIIFKYQLDYYYPHFRNMYEAKKILSSIVADIEQNHKRVIFIGDDQTGIDFVQHIVREYDDIHFCAYNRDDPSLHKLNRVDWNVYDCIYLISFYGTGYIERWFVTHHIKYEWIYDVFERNGIIMQEEFFCFGKEDLLGQVMKYKRKCKGRTETIQCELYRQRSKYERAQNVQTRSIALKKCLFLTLYMRDFLEAEKYILLLEKEDGKYHQAWEEIQELLESVRKSISGKERKDIVLYWLDALPSGDEEDMPYLSNIMENSVVFENAIPHTGYTHSVMWAMFLGKKAVDDKAYLTKKVTRENSVVIRLLEEQGYEIKIYSGIFFDDFPSKYLSDRFYLDIYTPGSLVLWDMICNMMQESKRTFYLVHIMDTHDPYLCGGVCHDIFSTRFNLSEQYALARQETDERLAFYDAFINQDAFRVYMSDHGKNPQGNRFHALFNVYHKLIEPRRIEGIFSFLDFNVVLRQIVADGTIRESEFIKEYAEIACMDRYSREDIECVMRQKQDLSQYFFGAKGIVDKEHIYLHYKTGKEWLQRRDSIPICNPLLFYDCEDDVCDTELLPRYRELAGEYPADAIEDEKFKYSKYLYVLYNNLVKRNNIAERIACINALLKDFPDRSVAVRMGGNHSVALYYVLSKENKKKIWGFIDNQKECMCSAFQLPIVGIDEMEELGSRGVKTVILSSYVNLKALREESRARYKNMDILDIYDYFEKNDIWCKGCFYEIKGTDSDYDIGFPYSE